MFDKEVKYGTVSWFNPKRGYGYITPDEGEKDFFIHWSNIVTEAKTFKTLVAGQRVSFVIGANKNGPQAEGVVILSQPKFGD